MVSYTALPMFSNGGSQTPAQYARRQKLYAILLILSAVLVLGVFFFGGKNKKERGGEEGATVVGSAIGDPVKKRDEYRVYVKEGRPVDHIIHQSWKTDQVPAMFQEWAATWPRFHPNWKYILWTDASNRELVKTHYPWFLSYYDRLPSNIARADTSRYFYMHKFGGIYADLDAECVRNFESLVTPERGTAFLAAMSDDYEHDHNIPNAWLASGKEHPFWLHMIYQIMYELEHGEKSAEWITGPAALKRAWKNYNDRVPADEREEVTILEPGYIYPFDWHRPHPTLNTSMCWAGETNRKYFNAPKCKQVLEAEGKPGQKAYMITYWTHSWSDDDNGTAIATGDESKAEAQRKVEGETNVTAAATRQRPSRRTIRRKIAAKKEKSHAPMDEKEKAKVKEGEKKAATAAESDPTGILDDPDI
ncbi:hypothetical protein HK104_003767 [Borealophlyctis nickersoniae]|nr:hypothetical protein HK104_003767 [Borealophlyctis nickersoniae]